VTKADADDELPPLRALVSGLTEGLDFLVADEHGALIPESLEVDLPIELAADGASGGLTLRASTPTQYTATTVMPVFHRLRLRIGRSG
jgi:hypothetical protein